MAGEVEGRGGGSSVTLIVSGYHPGAMPPPRLHRSHKTNARHR